MIQYAHTLRGTRSRQIRALCEVTLVTRVTMARQWRPYTGSWLTSQACTCRSKSSFLIIKPSYSTDCDLSPESGSNDAAIALSFAAGIDLSISSGGFQSWSVNRVRMAYLIGGICEVYIFNTSRTRHASRGRMPHTHRQCQCTRWRPFRSMCSLGVFCTQPSHKISTPCSSLSTFTGFATF